MVKKIMASLILLLIVVIMSSGVFATINNVCENIHVDTKMQDKYFGGSFGQEICLSGFQPNTYFINYSNGDWTWILHQCVKPEQEQNLIRFFYCGGFK